MSIISFFIGTFIGTAVGISIMALRGAANSYKIHYETAKAKAVKEFAERLKARAWIIQYYEDGTITPLLSVNDIDNLLKEMAGENDE